MARGEAEKASASGAMRPTSALQHSKCREFEPSAQRRYWMARDGYLFSVALELFAARDPRPRHDARGGRSKGYFEVWTLLIQAELFEVDWAIGLKHTDGFRRPWPTVRTVVAMIISLGLLGIAMKSLPVGTAYSCIW